MSPTVIQISPESEISFPAQVDQSAQSHLSLKNVCSVPVAFKIKVTAPKKYVVKPSFGTIAVGETQPVDITLLPVRPAPSDSGDRFLVQATAIGIEDVTKESWGSIDKSNIQEFRLSVVFKDRSHDNRVAQAADYFLALEKEKKDLEKRLTSTMEANRQLLQDLEKERSLRNTKSKGGQGTGMLTIGCLILVLIAVILYKYQSAIKVID